MTKDIKKYLLDLIEQRNKKELIFKDIIFNYQQLVQNNLVLETENKKLKKKILKSMDTLGTNINFESDMVQNNYF